jgi:hypothetical protein
MRDLKKKTRNLLQVHDALHRRPSAEDDVANRDIGEDGSGQLTVGSRLTAPVVSNISIKLSIALPIVCGWNNRQPQMTPNAP